MQSSVENSMNEGGKSKPRQPSKPSDIILPSSTDLRLPPAANSDKKAMGQASSRRELADGRRSDHLPYTPPQTPQVKDSREQDRARDSNQFHHSYGNTTTKGSGRSVSGNVCAGSSAKGNLYGNTLTDDNGLSVQGDAGKEALEILSAKESGVDPGKR